MTLIINKKFMLSIDECRKYLDDDGKNMADEQVKNLRDALYSISESVLDPYFKENEL